eukprot:UN00687
MASLSNSRRILDQATSVGDCSCHEDPCDDAFYDSRDGRCRSTCWPVESKEPCNPSSNPTNTPVTTLAPQYDRCFKSECNCPIFDETWRFPFGENWCND